MLSKWQKIFNTCFPYRHFTFTLPLWKRHLPLWAGAWLSSVEGRGFTSNWRSVTGKPGYQLPRNPGFHVSFLPALE